VLHPSTLTCCSSLFGCFTLRFPKDSALWNVAFLVRRVCVKTPERACVCVCVCACACVCVRVSLAPPSSLSFLCEVPLTFSSCDYLHFLWRSRITRGRPLLLLLLLLCQQTRSQLNFALVWRFLLNLTRDQLSQRSCDLNAGCCCPLVDVGGVSFMMRLV